MEQAVAAPICTRVLADFGARIIKVENPNGGDFARHYDDVVNGPGGLAAHFVWCNRGKESVTLNTKSPAGMDILHRLLDRADAFVSNLAPGSTAKMGIAAADLAQRHPNVIPVEIDGYGPGGPISHKRAYDLLVQAESGSCSDGLPRHARQTRACDGGLHHRLVRRDLDSGAAVRAGRPHARDHHARRRTQSLRCDDRRHGICADIHPALRHRPGATRGRLARGRALRRVPHP